MKRRWFDAHLDLAYLSLNGRDMMADLATCGGPHLPAAVTLPALARGNVRACLATIFTERDGADAVAYVGDDAESAHVAGKRQLDVYCQWLKEGRFVSFDHASSEAPRLGILMECADPIRSPQELGWWVDRGVIAIGLTWARGSRFATGNAAPSCNSPIGLTPPGKEMVTEMDRLGVVHDVSHLSDRALDDLLSSTNRPVIASHSNCRALLGGVNQRHLTDAAIREIARRGGVIGLNLVKFFIRADVDRANTADRPSVDDCLRHIEYICELAGHDRAVGLGSDLDGGISAHDLPREIDSPEGFDRLAQGLSRRGWSDERVDAFAWGNWARFFGIGGTVHAPR